MTLFHKKKIRDLKMLSWRCPAVTIFFSNFAMIYVFACIYYMIQTRNFGTPFYNSLTPQQRIIKKSAVKSRKKVFIDGMVVGIVLLLLWKPFKTVRW